MTDDVLEVLKLIMNVLMLIAWWLQNRPHD